MFDSLMYRITNLAWSEDDDKFTCDIQLPGADKKKIELDVIDDELHFKYPGDNFNGVIHREWTMPKGVKKDDVSAEYNNGILHLYINKAKREETRIQVK